MTNEDKKYIKRMMYLGIVVSVIAIISSIVAVISTLVQIFYEMQYLKMIAVISSILAAISIYAILVITKKIGRYLYEKDIPDNEFDDFIRKL